jgi:hypothetical protein
MEMHYSAPPIFFVFASCLTFHHHLEDTNNLHMPDNSIAHPYGPRPQTVLKYDSDLGLCGSVGSFVLEDMQGEEEGWVGWNGCKMLRRTAFGWVERDVKTGEGKQVIFS